MRILNLNLEYTFSQKFLVTTPFTGPLPKLKVNCSVIKINFNSNTNRFKNKTRNPPIKLELLLRCNSSVISDLLLDTDNRSQGCTLS